MIFETRIVSFIVFNIGFSLKVFNRSYDASREYFHFFLVRHIPGAIFAGMTLKINPDHIDFVLVEPMHPGNVGSAARALKTMGFANLVLVNPCDYQNSEARALAHASEEVLLGARVCTSLAQALEGSHWVVATTQRRREFQYPFYTPPQLCEKMVPMSREYRISLVFGRERTGLTNEEIQLCHAITTIPAKVTNPSLNLSQAVMLYAYALYNSVYEPSNRFRWDPAPYSETEAVYQHLLRSMQRTGFVPLDNWDKFLMRFRRVFSRAYPENRDVQLMHKIFQAFEYKLNDLEGRLAARENSSPKTEGE